MSVLVKICGLTDSRDVAEAVAAGADAVGFVFAESPRRVTPQQAATLARDVPGNVLRVAVMLHPDPSDWQQVAEIFAPDVLQTDAEDFAALDIGPGIRRWPVIREGRSQAAEATGHYIYEGARSGQGETVDWAQAASRAKAGGMILAGGLGPDNVSAAIRAVQPAGVDASSSLEVSPGQKCAEKMRAYVAAAKRASNE